MDDSSYTPVVDEDLWSARSTRVLIGGDEPEFRDMLSFTLRRRGFSVKQAASAGSVRQAFESEPPHLVILSSALSSLPELIRALKAHSRQTPIIVLTHAGDACERSRVLEAGADDHLAKPFSASALLARIHALLQGATAAGAAAVIGPRRLKLDNARRRLLIDQHPVVLGELEFNLLAFFMAHPQRIFRRAQLVDRVWRSRANVGLRSVDIQVSRLRRMLQPYDCDRYIETVRGLGYRFAPEIAPAP